MGTDTKWTVVNKYTLPRRPWEREYSKNIESKINAINELLTPIQCDNK